MCGHCGDKSNKHKAQEASKKIAKKGGSFEKMNAERKRQGYKPKTDRATKGLYDFLDK